MKLIKISLIFMLCYLFLSVFNSPVNAGSFPKYQKIQLPSCNVSISADRFYNDNFIHGGEAITYTGNVKVLIGLANLRINKVTLLKKKDGTCELISNAG